MRRVTKYLQYSPAMRALLAEAWLSLGLARLLLLTTEFKKIAPKLGKHMREVSAKGDAAQTALAKDIGLAVRTMSYHTVWESKCFAQAIAAKRMLTRRGIQSTLYLGVAKDDAGSLIAHAWITSCGLTLTGGRNAKRFTVVSVFGS